jgi:hypothetical protein
MNQRTSAILFVVAAVVGFVLIRLVDDGARRTFGHPGAFDNAVHALFWILGITHALIAVFMWMQPAPWRSSNAALFAFIAVKGIFWINLATTYVHRGFGQPLENVYLYVLLITTTAGVIVQLFRRYVLGTENDPFDRQSIALERTAAANEETAASSERTAIATEQIAEGMEAR